MEKDNKKGDFVDYTVHTRDLAKIFSVNLCKSKKEIKSRMLI